MTSRTNKGLAYVQESGLTVRAGQMPPADDIGVTYLRIPINALPRGGA